MRVTMEQQTSAKILAGLASGLNLEQAMDAVLGAGSYQRLAGEVYDQLRGAVEG